MSDDNPFLRLKFKPEPMPFQPGPCLADPSLWTWPIVGGYSNDGTMVITSDYNPIRAEFILNKSTHRIRFAEESEDTVRVIVERIPD